MQIRINFSSEIDQSIRDQINFVREEFEFHFNGKNEFTPEDRNTAKGLLNHLSKIINSANCIDYLTKTLEDLEISFPTLF
ncbi:MAG: hypothetical protein ACTSYI_09585 [Promethearchaeota archaeon]